MGEHKPNHFQRIIKGQTSFLYYTDRIYYLQYYLIYISEISGKNWPMLETKDFKNFQEEEDQY